MWFDLEEFKDKKYAHLMGGIFTLMTITALVGYNARWQILIPSLFFIIILLGLRTIAEKRWHFGIASSIAFVAFLFDISEFFLRQYAVCVKILTILSLLAYLVFVGITFLFILKDLIFRAERITRDELYGAVCGYLLLGLFWALMYMGIAYLQKDAFVVADHIVLSYFDFFYYSFVTLTTLGYGDILPNSSLTKMFSCQEAITGSMYMAIFISALINRYMMNPHNHRRKEGKYVAKND